MLQNFKKLQCKLCEVDELTKLANFLVLKWKFQAILTVISQACSFLLVNPLLKAMGCLFKFFILN